MGIQSPVLLANHWQPCFKAENFFHMIILMRTLSKWTKSISYCLCVAVLFNPYHAIVYSMLCLTHQNPQICTFVRQIYTIIFCPSHTEIIKPHPLSIHVKQLLCILSLINVQAAKTIKLHWHKRDIEYNCSEMATVSHSIYTPATLKSQLKIRSVCCFII
jgi:hypothetical protein